MERILKIFSFEKNNSFILKYDNREIIFSLKPFIHEYTCIFISTVNIVHT